ncbi:MAG: amidohydrolase family protein [Clostridia bacterium]|nr:amidohydrolase family protein [Clostridia bacterium]
MQTIFYNANIITFDENLPKAEAFFVNDGSIVLVGSNDEVLSMKTDDINVIDLKGKTVVPSFYDINARIYDLIEDGIKNAKLDEFLENNAEIDENYDKFVNFDIYKNHFLPIQEDYLANGITTVFELSMNSKEFTFWKKLSETGELKLDVIGYVDITQNKDIMDNNCRSYRKYKKHFRLGGYYLKIDDELITKKAWLCKPYKGEHRYQGYTNYVDEHLMIAIKTGLEEKKQFIVECNGDNALDQFLRCFREKVKDKLEEDKFKPIAKNCNFISKKHFKELKELDITPCFQIKDISEYGKEYRKSIGKFRASKIQPVRDVIDNGQQFLLSSKSKEIPNIFELAFFAGSREYDKNKVLGKKNIISFKEAINSLIISSSKFAFDYGFKGSIENGKRADFVVLNDSLEDIENNKILDPVLKTFIEGEEVFTK